AFTQQNYVLVRNGDVLRKTTINMNTLNFHPGANVFVAGSAQRAVPARQMHLRSNIISRLNLQMRRRMNPVLRAHAGSHFFDDAAEFMSDDDRFITLPIGQVTLHFAADAFTLGAVVYALVGAAYRRCDDTYLYFIGSEGRLHNVSAKAQPVCL